MSARKTYFDMGRKPLAKEWVRPLRVTPAGEAAKAMLEQLRQVREKQAESIVFGLGQQHWKAQEPMTTEKLIRVAREMERDANSAVARSKYPDAIEVEFEVVDG